jgi:hypothetical protein
MKEHTSMDDSDSVDVEYVEFGRDTRSDYAEYSDAGRLYGCTDDG